MKLFIHSQTSTAARKKGFQQYRKPALVALNQCQVITHTNDENEAWPALSDMFALVPACSLIGQVKSSSTSSSVSIAMVVKESSSSTLSYK